MRTSNVDVGAPVQSRARQVRWGIGCLFLSMLLVACSGGGGKGGGDSTPPHANAGVVQNVPVGSIVTLDASGSTDAGGDALTFQWTMVSKPAGSAAILWNAATVRPSFTADVIGTYAFKVVVVDATGNSSEATVTVTVSAANSAPVASAGPNQNVTVGATVSLDGSGSKDADGDLITYVWSFRTRPTGSTAAISDPTLPNPTFTADVAGSYVVQLVVNDGKTNSAAATVTITAAAANVAPVANAGLDQNATVGTQVTLDGTGSSDANNDTLTYSWSLTGKPTGSNAALAAATTAHPTFTPDVAGPYSIQLVVNDGKVNSSNTATVVITAAVGNSPPVANAGTPQNARVGDTVQLSGSATDANSDPLTYLWSFQSRPAGSTASLSNTIITNPTFVPDQAGSYVLNLVANDGHVNSAVSSVTITVTVNHAPVADAGTDHGVTVGGTATVDGSGSTDADGDQLSYAWTLTTRPGTSAATLANADTVSPTFVADVAGTYVLDLVVNDGRVNSSNTASVTVTAAVGNIAPVADAGPNQTVNVGSTVTLDGSASSDANLDTLTYAWTLTTVPGGSSAALSSTTAVGPTFTADVAGVYVASLVVNDGTVNSSNTATVTITANTPPVAHAGSNQNVTVGDTVSLDGSTSTDADSDPLTYAWSFGTVPGGSTAVLSDPTAVNPTFVPNVAGDYQVQLIVNDGHVNSAASTITITAASAGPTTTTFIPTFNMFSSILAGADPAVNGNVNFNAMSTTPANVPPVNIFSATAGKLRLYKFQDSSSNVYYTVYYNGTSVPDGDIVGLKVNNMTPTTSSTSGLQRFVSMPYTATAGQVTVTAYYTYAPGSGITCTLAHLMLVKKDGTILTDQTVCNGATTITATFTDASNTEVFLLYARSTDGGGGIQVSKMELTK